MNFTDSHLVGNHFPLCFQNQRIKVGFLRIPKTRSLYFHDRLPVVCLCLRNQLSLPVKKRYFHGNRVILVLETDFNLSAFVVTGRPGFYKIVENPLFGS